jgi:hypothetical protein
MNHVDSLYPYLDFIPCLDTPKFFSDHCSTKEVLEFYTMSESARPNSIIQLRKRRQTGDKTGQQLSELKHSAADTGTANPFHIILQSLHYRALYVIRDICCVVHGGCL